jgi:hypothetical protein
MAGLVSTLILLVFIGCVVNEWKRDRDAESVGRTVDRMCERLRELETQGKKHTADYHLLSAQIDRKIELMRKIEERDINPLR